MNNPNIPGVIVMLCGLSVALGFKKTYIRLIGLGIVMLGTLYALGSI